VSDSPETILVAQHGWADGNRAMLAFGRAGASPTTLVIAPDLGYRRTWLPMVSGAFVLSKGASLRAFA